MPGTTFEQLAKSPILPQCLTVVSVVGPSWDTVRKVCNELAGRCLFGANSEDIEVQYAVCDSVLYLISLDTCVTSHTMEALQKERASFNHMYMRKVEYDTLRSLLFLFLCSHIVLFVHDTHALPLHHFRTLSLLQASKTRLSPALKALKLPPAWPGKCLPWLMFVCAKDQGPAALKAMTTQTMAMLQACNLTRISGQDALFRCDTQFMVEVYGGARSKRREGQAKGSRSLAFLTDSAVYPSTGKVPSALLLAVQSLVHKIDGEVLRLDQWVETAKPMFKLLQLENRMCKNNKAGLFADLSSREPSARASKNKSTRAMQRKPQNAASTEALEGLDRSLKLEEKLIKLRCEAAVPAALEVYRGGVPALYNSKVHHLILEKAIHAFHQLSGGKGNICKRYEAKLIEQCKKIWQNPSQHKDRRLCDNVSLTGRPCTLLRRECVGRNGRIDPTRCRSGVLHKLVCSCGTNLIERSDPFDEVEGNVSGITLPCCKGLYSLDLNRNFSGTYSRSISLREYKRGKGGAWVLHYHGTSKEYNPEKGIQSEGFLPGYNLLEEWKEVAGFPMVHVGLEYLCTTDGRRHFFALPGLKVKRSSSAAVKGGNEKGGNGKKTGKKEQKGGSEWIEGEKVLAMWPPTDLQVFVASTSASSARKRSDAKNMSLDDLTIFQLTRVWVSIGPKAEGENNPGLKASLNTSITIQQGGQKEMVFTHSLKPLLPCDAFFCLQLPRLFRNLNNKKAPLQPYSIPKDGSKPFVSHTILKKGLLRIVEALD